MVGDSDLDDVFEVVNKHYREDDLKLRFHQEEEAFIPITVIEKQTNVKEKVNTFYLFYTNILYNPDLFYKSNLQLILTQNMKDDKKTYFYNI